MPFPFCSIVVPTFERPQRLRDCLTALARLDYPRDRYEVIVADDGSRVSPEPAIASFREQVNLRLLCLPHRGPAAARNAGAAQARGELLAFTDDDCMPEPQWLGALVESYGDARDRMLGGKTINALPENVYSDASQLLIDYLYGYYNADPNCARFLTSNNLSVPTELFRRVDGFDEAFPRAAGEDRELCDRWTWHGYRIAHAPRAVVRHAHPLGLGDFWQQHWTYGEAAWQFRLARARRSQQPVALEPLAFYVNLIKYPFRHRKIPQALGLALLFVLTQAANAAGFAWARYRARDDNAQ